MKTLLRLAVPAFLLAGTFGGFCAAVPAERRAAEPAALTLADLRCDGGVDPRGVDSLPPRLAWKLRIGPAAAEALRALEPQSSSASWRQAAYRILVASSREALDLGNGDVWDSGFVESDGQLNLPYAGRPLRSHEQVFWKVRVWDGRGAASAWSAPATWTMGALDAAAWAGAKWITDPELLRWQRASLGTRTTAAAGADDPKWLALDLGAAQPIDEVRLHGVRHTVDEFTGFPLRFKLEAANAPDFSDAVAIADFTDKDYPNPWTTRIALKPAAGPVTARYLKLTATKHRVVNGVTCLALSQWVVLSGGKNIAPGAAVTGSALVEDAQWSRTGMIDGLGTPGANPRANAPLYLRREFTVRPGLRRALAHVSGLGHYQLSVNGESAGVATLGGLGVLTPGWTDPAKTALYDTLDLTEWLNPGANALGLVLAGGMYNIQPGRYVKFVTPFRPLTAIVALRLEYDDGTSDTVVTDETWRVGPGPSTFANMFGGEDYDATREIPGWNRAGFEPRGWVPAVAHAGPGGTLRGWSHASPPLRGFEKIAGGHPKEIRPGVTVYDFGQNASMQLRLLVDGPRGATVKLTPAELLKPDGTVERRSSGGDDAWWNYTLAGKPEGEAWAPRFFYHGTRYVQAEVAAPADAPEKLPVIRTINSVVTHSDVAPAGDFACSNELFNRIRTLILWAQRSNLAHVLTDCPHRERLGWLEQYHLNGPSLRYENDLDRLFLKTFDDMRDAQTPEGLVPSVAPEYVRFAGGFRDSPEWGAAIVLAAWQHYVWTGDDTPLRRDYAAMQRYVAYLETKSTNRLLNHGLGDWYDLGPNRPGVAQLTPIAVTATAFWCESALRLGDIAEHLGQIGDARRYRGLGGEIASAFHREFFHADTGTYATGSQTAQALPLVLGIVPDHERARVLAALVQDIERRGHAVTAGDVGYRYVLRALAEGGRSDVIHAMNNQSEKPGYGYQLAQGATSLTEAWDADRRSGQNHFMLGQFTEWLYADLAGLAPDPTRPGFRRTLVAPQPVAGIDWARASHESPYGKVAVSWKRDAATFTLEVEVPPGAGAEVVPPFGTRETIRLGDRPAVGHPDVSMTTEFRKRPAFLVGPGKHIFTAPAGP